MILDAIRPHRQTYSTTIFTMSFYNFDDAPNFGAAVPPAASSKDAEMGSESESNEEIQLSNNAEQKKVFPYEGTFDKEEQWRNVGPGVFNDDSDEEDDSDDDSEEESSDFDMLDGGGAAGFLSSGTVAGALWEGGRGSLKEVQLNFLSQPPEIRHEAQKLEVALQTVEGVAKDNIFTVAVTETKPPGTEETRAGTAARREFTEKMNLVKELLNGNACRVLLERLRQDPGRRHQTAVRTAMRVYHENCAVSEAEWLLFLSEEAAAVVSAPDSQQEAGRQHLEALFREALSAGLGFSASLWTRFATTTAQLHDDPAEALKHSHRCFENGLAVVALDPDRSVQLFHAYRADPACTPAKREALWHRQLQIPSPYLEQLAAQYKATGAAFSQSEQEKLDKAKAAWSKRSKAFSDLLRCEKGQFENQTKSLLQSGHSSKSPSAHAPPTVLVGVSAASSSSSSAAASPSEKEQHFAAAKELIAVEKKSKDVQRLDWAYLRCCESLLASNCSFEAEELAVEYAEFVSDKVRDVRRAARILDRVRKASKGYSGVGAQRLLLAEQISGSDSVETLHERELFHLMTQLHLAEPENKVSTLLHSFINAVKLYGDALRRCLGKVDQMRSLYQNYLDQLDSLTTRAAAATEGLADLAAPLKQCQYELRAHWMRVEAYNFASLERVTHVWPPSMRVDVQAAGTAFKALRFCSAASSSNIRDVVLSKMLTLVNSVADRPDLLAFEYVDLLRHDPETTKADLEAACAMFRNLCQKHNAQVKEGDEIWDESPDDPMCPFGVNAVGLELQKAATRPHGEIKGSSSSENNALSTETSGITNTTASLQKFVEEKFKSVTAASKKDHGVLPLLHLAWVKAEAYSLNQTMLNLQHRIRDMFKQCPAANRVFDWWWAVLQCARHCVRNKEEDLRILTDLYKMAIQQTGSEQLAKDLFNVLCEVSPTVEQVIHAQHLLAQTSKKAQLAEEKQQAKSNKRQQQADSDVGVLDGTSGVRPKKRPRPNADGDVDMLEDDAQEEMRLPRGVRPANTGRNRKKQPKKPKKEGGAHYLQVTLGPDAAVKFDEAKKTVFVRNIDVHVDEPELERLVAEHAVPGLQEVRVVRDFRGNPKGWAYLDFDEEENVRLCCEKLHNLELHSRKLFAKPSKPTQQLYEPGVVFLTNVARGFDLRAFFQTQHGLAVKDVRFLSSAGGGAGGSQNLHTNSTPAGGTSSSSTSATGLVEHQTCNAFVEFEQESSVEKAIHLESLPPEIQKIERSIPMKNHEHKYAKTRKDAPGGFNDQLKWKRDLDALKAKAKNTLFVKNLNKKTTEAGIRQHFALYGEITQIALMKNEHGKNKGFGFLELKTAEEAAAALQLNNSDLDGRKINVAISDRPITNKKEQAETTSTARVALVVDRSEDGQMLGKSGKNDFGQKKGPFDKNASKGKDGKKGGFGKDGKKKGGKNSDFKGAKKVGGKENKGSVKSKDKGGMKKGFYAGSEQPETATGAAPMEGVEEGSGVASAPMSNADFRKFLMD
ncbi:unnamed protein product [Amoebophrya sp. A120]|nr:unnamed protein product [Amoebophrya sp. A120]|eukprot:GSA120T00023996001.1